jgi:hypothetical protein
VNFGVIKKDDYHYVIAGQTDNSTGDVLCELHGFNDDYWIFEIEDTTVGMPEIPATEEKVLVYPNPASSILNIKFLMLKEDNYLVEIFDVFGKKVKEIKVPKVQIKVEVNVEIWRKGLYLVKAGNGKNYYESQKVLVQ